MTKNYDVVIIGGGPSGHSSAVRIAELGGKVAIIERDFIGGICTNWGCTPSKAMIESAKIAHDVARASDYGIDVGKVSVDFSKVAARRNQVIESTRAFITELLHYHKVDIYQGEAFIHSSERVIVKHGKLDPDGFTMHYTTGEEELLTKNIIIATGSQPLIPGFIDEKDPSIISSNRLISIENLPKILTIVGGGVIGMEFATIFSSLGSKVQIVEFLPRCIALTDPDISEYLTKVLEKRGVKILTNHKVLSIHKGQLEAENQATKELIHLKSDMFLIAIGRKAVIHNETYQKLGIQFTAKGVEVNDYLQTNVPGIWAIGDATGKSILAHVGIQQGIIAAENIMSKKNAPLRKMDYSVIPAVIYSIPEVAMVGTVPEDLKDVKVVKVPFAVNLRANIEDNKDGFIKLWIKDNRLLAAQATGYNVSEIFQEFANMIALKTDIREVSEIIHAHPTYSEIARSGLDFALGKAVDFHS
jgi:dihydrolipoamide dehydrogenase